MHEAKIVQGQKTPSPLLHLSREAKDKVPCVYSEATVTPLASTTLVGSVKPAVRETEIKAPTHAKQLCREARGKTLLNAISKAPLTSLAGKALHKRAKFASMGITKVVASQRVKRSYSFR